MNRWSATALRAAALSAFLLTSRELAAQRVVSSRVTVSTTARSYQVGDSSVSERVASARYELFAPRVKLALNGTALRYAAAGERITGNLPLGARLDFAPRVGDTISVFARSASRPLDLTTRQAAALGTAGTSTVDLESSAVGSPALGGMRLTFALPVGEQVLAVRGGVETEPRPAGTEPVYWRGTTLRGGLALTSSIGAGQVTASVDVTRSSADSLGGRNLFPGGGLVTLQLLTDLSLTNPFDPLEDEQWPVRLAAFYGSPFGSDRADQPNLLIPRGTLMGALGTILVPVNALMFAPSLQFLRESSQSESQSGLLRSTLSGHAWTAQAGLDVSIPVGGAFELTPGAGYTVGTVGASFSQGVTGRRGRVLSQVNGFSDGVRGGWLTLELSATF